ncbi:MAG: PAS domain-containing sensor histidine kinase, partial [Acidimicrobiales bacterium]
MFGVQGADMAFRAGGETGALCRQVDWSATGFGPVADWPESLCAMVGLCLASGFPMALCWGKRLSHLYNDGFRAILGARHPEALGMDTAEVL